MMDILDARHFLIRQRILRAIASHSCDYIYHLKLDMSFLLRIIDEMQEWGRPKLSDLFSKPPGSELEIYTFNNEEIDYGIKFEYEDSTPTSVNITKVHESVKDFFIRKINTYIMVLRSAVDGKNRNFTLRFSAIDLIDDKGIKITYEFVHENSKSIHLYCNYEDRGEEALKELPMNILEETNWEKFVSELKKLSTIPGK
jgi:hypothetical protein